MRAIVLFALVSGPMMAAGWPNHWIILGAAFVAGLLAGITPGEEREARRGGYVHPPSPLNDRIGRYTEGQPGERSTVDYHRS